MGTMGTRFCRSAYCRRYLGAHWGGIQRAPNGHPRLNGHPNGHPDDSPSALAVVTRQPLGPDAMSDQRRRDPGERGGHALCGPRPCLVTRDHDCARAAGALSEPLRCAGRFEVRRRAPARPRVVGADGQAPAVRRKRCRCDSPPRAPIALSWLSWAVLSWLSWAVLNHRLAATVARPAARQRRPPRGYGALPSS
jgi:hypothetical protein